MEVKARREMDPAYQWDFSHIFPTREAWEQAYAEAGERSEEHTSELQSL